MIKLSKNLNLLTAIAGLFTMISIAGAAVIQKGDTVKISLKGVPVAEQVKVNGEYKVRDSGNIRIPIINENIQTAGRTPEQVERSIESAFKSAQIYTAPTISLQVIADGKMPSKVISVGGQVKKPGRVQFRDGMTLAEAIQQAGDRTPFASKYLYLTRKNKEGKLMRYKYNFKEPQVQTLRVYPDDLITIPQRGIIDKG